MQCSIHDQRATSGTCSCSEIVKELRQALKEALFGLGWTEARVEKQALAGVLAPIARRHHVTLMTNKGYSSASAMKASAARMIAACGHDIQLLCVDCKAFGDDREGGKCNGCGRRTKVVAVDVSEARTRTPILLYLGDHDPSGEDMVRDIRTRLIEFGVVDVDVRKVALTMTQIRRHRPPPNPAKMTDSRAEAYVAAHGNQSWELDALPPQELNALVEAAIVGTYDRDLMNAIISEEQRQRDRIEGVVAVSRDLAAKRTKVTKKTASPAKTKPRKRSRK